MKLHEIADNAGATKSRKRIGRGPGSGTGKTGGRGIKGQTSRSGVAIKGFEGGQMPIHRRLPKRGFNNINAKKFAIINLKTLADALERGAIDAPLPTPMNGATYMADLIGGQKTGLFFDQRPNHAFAARLAKGADVLDVFSHVGGFALACLAGGAASAVSVDSSAPALALAEEGAAATGVADRFSTLRGQAFDVMRQISQDGRRFDLVVSDPPAFAPTKGALEKGLRAYETAARLAAGLVKAGGYLCVCSCSHAAGPEAFRAASVAGIRKAGRRAALIHAGQAGPDHPAHFALPETSYLKALFFRLD